MATRPLAASRDELAAHHKSDERYLNAKLSQLSKPKLGQKPLSKEDIAERTALLTREMRERHEAEVSELESRLAAAPPPTPVVVPSSPAAAVPSLPNSFEGETPATPSSVASPAPLLPATPGTPGSSPHTGTRADRRKVGRRAVQRTGGGRGLTRACCVCRRKNPRQLAPPPTSTTRLPPRPSRLGPLQRRLS